MPGLLAPGAAHAERPTFTIAPYVWAPNIRGKVSLGALAVPVSLPVRDLAKGFKGGGLGYVSADWHDVFLYGEGIYIRFGDKRFDPFFGESVRASVTFAEGGFGMHRTVAIGPRATVRVSPYVGVRYIALHARIAGALITTTTGNKTADPVAGVILEAPVAARVKLIGKVDGASFRLTRDHYLSVAGLAEYRFGRHVAIDAGYRYTRASIPSPTDLGLSLRGSGPMLGLRYTIDR